MSSVFDFVNFFFGMGNSSSSSSSSSSLSVSTEIVASSSPSSVPAKRILICGSPGISE